MSLKEYFQRNKRVFAFLAFLVFAVYLNSLGNDFVSDDIDAIRDNPLINKFDYLTYFQFNLRSVVYFLTNKIFGLDPLFFRLPNILFHLGSSWLIFGLLSLFLSSPVPFFAASLFAVHPLLTEGVTWISGGAYSNATFFLLFSLLTYFLFSLKKSSKMYFLSICLFLIASLFSEKVFIFPAVIFVYEIFLNPNSKKPKIKIARLMPFIIISLLWLFRLLGLLGLRTTILQTNFYQQPKLYNPFLQVPIAVTSYLQLIFWPDNLTLYHSEMVFTPLEFLIRLAIFVGFILFLIWSFKYYRWIFFWLSFFLISLLPTLTPFGVSWLVAERYVYLGSIGIFVIIAILIQKAGKISKNQQVSYVIFGIVILLLSMRTVIRNADWQNQDILWLASAKTSLSSPQNHNNLGDLYGRQGKFDKAVEEFKKAIELVPNYADAYHNLANTYSQMGKFDLAIANYQKALFFNPRLWQSYQGLAGIYFSREQYGLAVENLNQALKINPENSNLHVNLGVVYLKLDNKQKAKEELRKALELNPQNQTIRQLFLSF